MVEHQIEESQSSNSYGKLMQVTAARKEHIVWKFMDPMQSYKSAKSATNAPTTAVGTTHPNSCDLDFENAEEDEF